VHQPAKDLHNKTSLPAGESVLNLDFATIVRLAKEAKAKGDTASALGNPSPAPVVAVAAAAAADVDGPDNGPVSGSDSSTSGADNGPDEGLVQGQVAAGGLDAGQLRSAITNVASVRDVVLKLAAKPNLLQYVQQKQVRGPG
jgi:hypothetical protein